MCVCVCSCNSTADELTEEVVHNGEHFAVIDCAKTHPTFQFGGVVGSRVCTVAFERSCDRANDDSSAAK